MTNPCRALSIFTRRPSTGVAVPSSLGTRYLQYSFAASPNDNVINGFLAPDRGGISFAGDPITGLRPNQVCRRGIGRTFQVVRAFPRMTVLENVIVGAFVGAKDDSAARDMALVALDRVGLGAQAQKLAGGLTTRELRLMELARALVPHPRLMLLDETLAGLGHDDLDGILTAIRQLRADGITIVIIEHTMHAMVRLADRLVVLDHGEAIATGGPATGPEATGAGVATASSALRTASVSRAPRRRSR